MRSTLRLLAIATVASLVLVSGTVAPATAATVKCRAPEQLRFCAKFAIDRAGDLHVRVWAGDLDGKRDVDVKTWDVLVTMVTCDEGTVPWYWHKADSDGWFRDYDPATVPKHWTAPGASYIVQAWTAFRYRHHVHKQVLEISYHRGRC
jgi:hypothetical protein